MKKKMAYGIVSALAVGLLYVQAGQAETSSAKLQPLSEPVGKLKTVEMSGDVVHQYQSVEELKRDASLIVHVKADKKDSFQFNRVVFTVSNATIQKVFKGNTDSKTINILETGGLIGDENYVFEGSPVLAAGDEAILFLQKYNGPVTKDAYVVLGAYQGKYDVKGDNLTAQKQAHENLRKVRSLQNLGL